MRRCPQYVVGYVSLGHRQCLAFRSKNSMHRNSGGGCSLAAARIASRSCRAFSISIVLSLILFSIAAGRNFASAH